MHKKNSKRPYFYRLKKGGQVIDLEVAKLLTLKWPKCGQVIDLTAYICIHSSKVRYCVRDIFISTHKCKCQVTSVGFCLHFLSSNFGIPWSPQALPTGNKSQRIISHNFLPDNYRDKFQVKRLATHYVSLPATGARQNHRVPG